MPTAGKVKYPYGAAEVLTLTAGDAAQNLTIVNDLTIVDGVTNEATVARTINVTVDTDSVNVGAKLFIKTKTNATENTVFGTGITGTTYAGVAGKTITKTAIYDGVDFKIENEQID